MDAELVVVGTYVNNFQAEVARTALEAAGIESLLQSDDCGGNRPHLWFGGVQLLVRAEDAGQASEVLAEPAIVEESLEPSAE